MTTNTSPACAEQATATSGETLSRDDLQAAIAQAWQTLQDTPSYVDQQIAPCRGLLDSIASPREQQGDRL